MSLLAFIAVAIVIIVTPGPDMALITRNALVHGRRAALFTALGIMVGLMVWTAASVVGLVALLATSAVAFTVVKLAGAGYLVYLGIRTVLSLRDSPSGVSATPSAAPKGSPFRQGLLTNLLNPKIAVLFTSLIPQFVSPGPSATLESVLLAAIFATLGLVWLTTYALVASAAAAMAAATRYQAGRQCGDAVRSWLDSVSAWPPSPRKLTRARGWSQTEHVLHPVLSSVPTQRRANGGMPVARVTVVNDNPEFLALVKDILEDDRYETTTIDGDLPDALDQVRGSRPDLLMIDLRMGSEGLHGWDIAQQVRAEPDFAGLPVLICSADVLALKELEDDLDDTRYVETLTKPFSIDDLTGVIDGMLAEGAAR